MLKDRSHREIIIVKCIGSYREVLRDKILDTAHEAIGGSPWDDETEAALQELLGKVDAAVSENPALAKVFDAQIPDMSFQ